MAEFLGSRSQSDGLLQAEFKQSFAGNLSLLTLGNDLAARSYATASCCADRCALSAAGYAANDCAENRTTANFLCGISATALTLYVVIAAHERIIAAFNHDAGEL